MGFLFLLIAGTLAFFAGPIGWLVFLGLLILILKD